MTNVRVRDFLILIGHTWICLDCRSKLLENTEATLIGHKLSEFERERVLELKDESFRTMMDLETATGLSADEIYLAIDHPRSRLRHLVGRRQR
jgi:hypothetical protein